MTAPTPVADALTTLTAALRAYERGADETGAALLSATAAALFRAEPASPAERQARREVAALALSDTLTPARLDAIRARIRTPRT